MTEETQKEKKVRLKGFPMVIGNIINSVRDTPACKDLIRGMRTRVLFNNKEDKRWACLVTVDKDQIKVEGVRKEGKDSLSRKKLFFWGYWEFPNLETMMKASSWGSGKWIRKMGSGKVKGASQIALIGQILALARPPEPPEENK
ncbi:MAG: hypothetical protein ACFFDK_08995 [Promethearchaeota archaeon]